MNKNDLDGLPIILNEKLRPGEMKEHHKMTIIDNKRHDIVTAVEVSEEVYWELLGLKNETGK